MLTFSLDSARGTRPKRPADWSSGRPEAVLRSSPVTVEASRGAGASPSAGGGEAGDPEQRARHPRRSG